MKLQKKLTVIFMILLTLALGICGGITLYQTRKFSIETMITSYEKQLEAVSYSFSQFSSRQEFEGMSDVVQQAFLKFEFEKCCGDGYGLVKEKDTVVNLTDYDILLPQGMGEEHLVQTVGQKQILIIKRKLVQPQGYDIFSIHDITEAYSAVQRQLVLYLVVYGIVLLGVMVLTVLVLKKALGPLEQLKTAAIQFSGGDLETRVKVKKHDEIGELGAAFNHMAGQIETQIEDLKLLLGALTHEIKTPMTSIIGYSDSLLHVDLSETQKIQALQYIYREGKRLELLSGKMMSLLGVYENETIEFEWISVEELFAQVEAIEQEYLNAHQMVLRTKWEPGLKVRGDVELLKCLLGNFIQNSVRASGSNTVIWLRGTGRGLEVIDHGCGIEKEEIGNITKAFYRVDKSRARKDGGAGLGLAICSRIATLHHAVIQIHSQVGCGTRIEVVFPEAGINYKTFTV